VAQAPRRRHRAARREPGAASEDQVRAVIGGVLFAASLYYVVSTLVRVARTARG